MTGYRRAQPLHVMTRGDPARSEEIRCRAGLWCACPDLLRGEGDLMLKLCARTGQQLDSVSVVTAERRAQFCLADDPTQIFRYQQSGVIARFAIRHVPDFARPHDPPL